MIKIIISILLASISISEDLNESILYTAYDSNINLTISFSSRDYVEKEVKGVQFDLAYDIDHLILNELTSLIDGATFEYMHIEDGKVRCVIFNLNGKAFSNMDLRKLIIASFNQKTNFYNITYVQIDNVIVVGEFGEDVSGKYESKSFQVDFDRLQPVNTSIHKLEQNIFQDSLLVSFQTHKDCNATLNLYDVFGLKRKTLLDQYVDVGVYESYVNIYDDLQEELEEGPMKIKLLIDYIIQDSIYVVYDKNKN